jgi:hypothetical protein
MDRRPFLSTVLALLTALTTACGCGGRAVPRPANTRAPPPAPEPTDTPVAVEPTNTADSDQPPPRPQPTSTPMEETVALTELKEELFYGGGGGGGGPGCWDYFLYSVGLSIEDLPATEVIVPGSPENVMLCLYGFPLDEVITVGLVAPNGDFYFAHFSISEEDTLLTSFPLGDEWVEMIPSEGAVYYGVEEIGRMQNLGARVFTGLYAPEDITMALWDFAGSGGRTLQLVGSAAQRPRTSSGLRYVVPAKSQRSVTVIESFLWFPVGLPTGEWDIVASSASAVRESSFMVERPDRAISTMPYRDISPFEDRYGHRDSYSAGEQVSIQGTNFEPNADLPLGLYYLTEHSEEHDGCISGTCVAALVSSGITTTDNQGDFSASVLVEPSYPAGCYCIASVDWHWGAESLTCGGPCFTVTVP